jgi:hypothetical protein
MSELERLKEQLAYLKFWQGIMVVTDISLVGWLVSTADGARAFTVVLAIIGVIALTFGIVVLHHQILSIVSIRSGDCSHGNYCRYRHARRRIRVCRYRTRRCPSGEVTPANFRTA